MLSNCKLSKSLMQKSKKALVLGKCHDLKRMEENGRKGIEPIFLHVQPTLRSKNYKGSCRVSMADLFFMSTRSGSGLT